MCSSHTHTQNTADHIVPVCYVYRFICVVQAASDQVTQWRWPLVSVRCACLSKSLPLDISCLFLPVWVCHVSQKNENIFPLHLFFLIGSLFCILWFMLFYFPTFLLSHSLFISTLSVLPDLNPHTQKQRQLQADCSRKCFLYDMYPALVFGIEISFSLYSYSKRFSVWPVFEAGKIASLSALNFDILKHVKQFCSFWLFLWHF